MSQINLTIGMFVYGSLALPGLFMLGAYSFLPGGKHSLKTLAALLAIAGASWSLWFAGALTTWGAAIIAAPLLQFAVISAAYRIFVWRCGRPPRDVSLNWEPGLVADRAYAIIMTLAPIFAVVAAFAPWMPGRAR